MLPDLTWIMYFPDSPTYYRACPCRGIYQENPHVL